MAGPSARFGVNVKPNDELEVSLPTVPLAHGAVWWSGRAAWAVFDQGLFASSNFALGILFARWVSSEQFGSFAVAQSCFPPGGNAPHRTFQRTDARFRVRHGMTCGFPPISRSCSTRHWCVTGVGSFLLACVALVCWFSNSLPLAGAFLGAAVGTPFILFGWFVRRACLSRLQPQWAATGGGGLYLLLLITGVYLLSVLDQFCRHFRHSFCWAEPA